MNYIVKSESGGPTDLTTNPGPHNHGPALGQFKATRPMTLRVGLRLKSGLNASSANTYTARVYQLDSALAKIGETSPISFKKLATDTKVTMHLTGASVPVLLANESAEVHVLSSGPGDTSVTWEVDYIDEQSANDLTPDATQVLARAVGAFRGDVWFVDPSAEGGFDGRSPVTPFQTIGQAISAASPGDVIRLPASANAIDLLGGRIVLPDDVSLIGAGRRLTRILSTAPLTDGVIVKPGKRSQVAHMTIEGTSATEAQAPIGWAGSDANCDLATLEDLDLVSNTGGLSVSGTTGVVTVFARRIRTRTKVDSVAASGATAGHTIYLWDSVVESIGPNGTNPVRGMIVKNTSRIVAVNCEIRAADAVITSSIIGCLVEASGGEIRLFNCRVDVSRPPPPPPHDPVLLRSLSNDAGAAGVLRVTGGAFDRTGVMVVGPVDIVPVQAAQV